MFHGVYHPVVVRSRDGLGLTVRNPTLVFSKNAVDAARSKRSGLGPAPERILPRPAETTMSNPHLPAEILDHIVDHLHDAEDELMSCCLASKSWISRTRAHLFADIEFCAAERLQSWRERFPDPSTSPSCYTRTLSITCLQGVTTVDAEEGGWIRGFSRVEHLVLDSHSLFANLSSLIPFHGFSPDLKSLHITLAVYPPPRVFNLILSFPLLEDLAINVRYATAVGDDSDELPATAQPLSPPVFTGSLQVPLLGGMVPFTRRLLSLSSGIHFRKLTLTCFREQHLSSIVALVEGCSHNLESLDISDLRGTSIRYLRLRL